MRPISLPEIPYGATSVRPEWLDLPSGLRSAVADRLGHVAGVRVAGGGFTRAFAGTLTMPDGSRAFVKAAPIDSPTAGWYAREAAITAALPDEVRAARVRWTMSESGYFALCLEAVDGHMPDLPWSQPELDAAVGSWNAAAEALSRPTEQLLAAGIPPLPEIIRAEMSWWSAIGNGQVPMFPEDVGPVPLARLAALEQALPALVAGTGLTHGDLRLDNVLIGETDGRAWLCDWTWPALGAPWFDTVTLLVSAFASGRDVDAYLDDAPAEGVDGALAALSGYWLASAARGPSSASPHSRQHQRFSGGAALSWLAERQGW